MASPVTSQEHTETGGMSSATSVACNRCRRTKLRCSRDRPTCTHCSKSRQQCIYESKRAKPGVKVGAIESIHHRLDNLEKKVSEVDASAAIKDAGDWPSSGAAEGVLALLARELPKLLSGSQSSLYPPQQSDETIPARKRRRLGSGCKRHDEERMSSTDRPPLPDFDSRRSMADAYFTHIHPWVPMVHQDRFRENLENIELPSELQLLMLAISLVVSRYLPVDDASSIDTTWTSSEIRRWILVTAMETVTLEGLQALILIAFDEVNSGNAPRAWSLVASLSRTVEFAQLTMEHDNDLRQAICPPFSHLPPARDWADLEERRRIFWNVFHLDRLFSITMGWNTSLTSIDVHQRLPCDGIRWRRQHEAVLTPYLGIWDKSTGGIGNKLRAPHRAEQAAQSTIDSELWSPQAQAIASSSPSQISGEIDMSKVGSFGFCIEAIESMSRVTTYFLQQRINTSDPREVDGWLSRFKELDLRLVHWKMFLPHKWKPGPALSTTMSNARMDPNLTLAHITHNASTILLHQVIAYPPSHWLFRKKLPSVWSAETCCSAGSEIATITNKYLESTPAQLPVASPLLSFCLFLAARMMIVHWRFDSKNTLLEEFWSLSSSLQEMSRRWRGVDAGEPLGRPDDLAAKYSQRLNRLYQRSQEDEHLRICVTAYTQENDARPEPAQMVLPQHSPSYPQHPYNLRRESMLPSPGNSINNQSFTNIAAHHVASDSTFGTSVVPPLQMLPDQQPGIHPSGMSSAGGGGSLNEYFMDLDRVIAFNDGSLFTAEWDNSGW